MPVTVVYVGEVWVTVGERFVNVSVGMRITRWVIRCMRMLMMSVMDVRVGV